MKPILYTFWRSSCSWRVRWALAIKGIDYEARNVDILHAGQDEASFRKLNPMRHVPALVIEGRCLAESTAIIERLDEIAPEPAFFPKDPWLRARVRQLVSLVASGIQPLQNTRVLGKIDPKRGSIANEWAAHFNEIGLAAYEETLALIHEETGSKGPWSVGDAFSAADLFLVPQVYSARRFKVDVSRFPRVLAAETAALTEPHATAAFPENQPDAPKR